MPETQPATPTDKEENDGHPSGFNSEQHQQLYEVMRGLKGLSTLIGESNFEGLECDMLQFLLDPLILKLIVIIKKDAWPQEYPEHAL